MQKVKVLFMDVDGTLTDGGLYVGSQGELIKKFHVKDGYGIKNVLPQLNIEPVILTGRKSEIVSTRCKELNIRYCIQGSEDKVTDMKTVLEKVGAAPEECAYIGDDLNDLPCMELVGVRGCPADAVDEIRTVCEFIASKDGGNGAVREFIEWIKRGNKC